MASRSLDNRRGEACDEGENSGEQRPDRDHHGCRRSHFLVDVRKNQSCNAFCSILIRVALIAVYCANKRERYFLPV